MKEKLRSWVIRKEVLVVLTASTQPPQLHSSVFPLYPATQARFQGTKQTTSLPGGGKDSGASDKGILMSLLHFISDGLSHVGLES